jgi:hypothetical protein
MRNTTARGERSLTPKNKTRARRHLLERITEKAFRGKKNEKKNES